VTDQQFANTPGGRDPEAGHEGSTTHTDAADVWASSAVEPGVAEVVSGPSLSGRQRFWRRFKRQRPALVALGFLVFISLVALAAPLLAPRDPNAQVLTRTLESPSWDYWLGTDDVGRDVFSRLIYASRLSLLAALQAVGVGVVLGVPPGLAAGYLGRRADLIIMRITDAIMSFPPLILAIAIVGVLGPNLTNAMIAVGVVFAPRFVRLVRGTVLAVREETFIEASRSIGTPAIRIVRRHILPNVLSPLIVQISLAAGFAMLAEASLSFLGLGAQPPDASWGSMLGRGVRNMTRAPWLIFAPGAMIALTVLAFNVLGDGIRDSIGREVRRAE
jgi:peptide/nickel transport system permease protein